MTLDPARIGRIMMRLQSVWASNPNLSFGQMIEKIEDEAWRQLEVATQRGYSARWANLPDQFLEGALTECEKRGKL